jgi:predicted Zn-dependent peptidase
MISKRILQALALSCFLPWTAKAQNANWKEATSAGYSYKYLPNDPTNSRFYTLKNGLTVILSKNEKEPRVQTYIAVKAGSKTDPATHTGLAHYLEHMLFKGTDKFGTLDWNKEKPYLNIIDALYEQYNSTKDEAKRKSIYKQIDSVSGIAAQHAIANEYDKLMASMGAKGTNAWTSFEETVYTEDVPSNALNKYLAVQAERFRNPILRIFHTELEAVYEEKNRGLDNDGRKQFEAMFAGLFKNHNYGLQTTIGTVEHLKNPSLVEIRKYFHNYYVPNNMGIIMVGDFNPDELIKQIDKDFAYMKPKDITPYTYKEEAPINTPIQIDVFGPEAENIMMGYRLPGANHPDAKILELVGKILTNGSAGLMDINLVLEQKLLGAYAFPYVLKDYSMLILQGRPVEGQSLDDVKNLMLGEIEKLKKGEFPEALLTAIINNEKKSLIETFENYSATASDLVSHFTTEIDWSDRVNYANILSKITKQDIIAFAKKYFGNNYVAVYKKQGEDKSISKVEKPTITPVPINREAQSDFFKEVNKIPENVIEPKWLDYNKDINRLTKNNLEFLGVENKDNALFRLYYRFETGTWNNKLLGLAADYINYIGTKDMSAAEFSQEMYNLAATFSVSAGTESTNIYIDGLNENFDKTLALVEKFLNGVVADEAALDAYKARLMKSRENNKKNKGMIMRGLQSYAQYGAKNPFNNTLTDQELKNLKAQDLINAIKDLLSRKHVVVYYGPQKLNNIATKVTTMHKEPKGGYKNIDNNVTYKQIDQNNNSVLFAHYDMVQAEIGWLRNADQYSNEVVPTMQLFNEYFGGGMGSIVFQTIRESKALAYSTYSYFSTPSNKDYRNTVVAYVGTQSDKLKESVAAMNELLNDLPQSDKAVETAKENLRKSLATQRITQESIVFHYLNAKKMGRNFDIRKNVYSSIENMNYNTLKAFHDKEMKNKKFTYTVLANKEKIDMNELKKMGEVKELSLQEIFGY